MKRRLFTFALAALTIGLLGSCSKINERIDDLDKRVYDLENNKIASIDQQITAINTSINDLKAADVTINGKIDELKATAQAHQTLIDALKEADKALGQKDTELEARIATLEGQVATINGQIATLEDADKAINIRIDELQSYVDTEIGKTKDWAEETFATLEQYQQTADNLATLSVTVTGISTTLTGVQTSITGLDTKINGIDAALQGKITAAKTELEGKITSLKTELEDKIASAISASETSIKAWINELLEGYYTAAQVDAKVTELNTSISNIKDADKARIDSLATELTTLKTAVDTAKAAIRTEYKNAIDEAINKLDGKIRGALLDSIAAVNGRIEALDTRVTTLEGKVLALEGKVDKLFEMVQSVTIVPAYSDGSVESTKDGVLYLDIIVSPAQAVATLTKDSLKVLVNEVKTRAVDVNTVAVTKFKVDAAKGTITARADISSVLPASGKALTIAVNVRNGISDYTTEFYPVFFSTESNVTVTDEGSTTKVTIKADENFPESSAGNIVVADGFKDSKPTTVDIEVGGRGTVIFDAKATSQIKANAQQAGATSVFFKVEDVTTTKPVENADVVLEVTMKTVDEHGTEVFNEDNAGEGAEVTIQIPMDENVAYVNSVTLVNDAGEHIEGGVVPGSEEIENGILTFKVNHFSKYAVDYVTKTDFVAVTGVRIEPESVTLQVGDTLRLAAVIAPENATNKKVTWSSSDTTKVKVDDTGKITAVAFGQATITVITKDGNKTADCTVKVYEMKTMADILQTTTGIPESQDLTPPANAWVNSTDPDCKAFIGKNGEAKLFVILKEGQPSASLKLRMDDAFARIDDNTYQRIEPRVGTFTIKMAEGKFTSYEFAAVSGSAYEQFNGTYAAPTLSGVTLNKTELSLMEGKSETLVATVQPENATNKNVTWSSSNESVATVDNDGKVTAVSKGTATITVTTVDGAKTASCEVTVIALNRTEQYERENW